jgi:hypothetical protein
LRVLAYSKRRLKVNRDSGVRQCPEWFVVVEKWGFIAGEAASDSNQVASVQELATTCHLASYNARGGRFDR